MHAGRRLIYSLVEMHVPLLAVLSLKYRLWSENLINQ